MKVLYHHRTRGKGAEGAHIKGIVTAFRNLGHQVTLTSIHNVDPTKPPKIKEAVTEEKKGIKHKVLEMTKHMPEFVFETLELMYNFIACRQVAREIKKETPDVIYERYSLFMFGSLWYAKRKGIPFILEVNDSALVERVRHLMFKRIACKIESWVFKHATGIVFISNYFKDLAESNHKEMAPCVVSPNAADTEVFNPSLYNQKSAKERFGVTGKVVCGFAGAFHHWHGIDWFVDDVVSELKNHKDIVLLLVGDGPRHQYITDLAREHHLEDQIILTGRVEHSEIPLAIAAMDFGIIPDSNDYGSPMKLFEFMAMGKGMIVPDFSPITDVVIDNKTSWLFPKKDKRACVEKFFEVAENEELIKNVGKNAIDYIETSRQWRHNVEQIIELANNKTS